ncbi:MAG: hypothetical protein RI924_198 [Bacteroidota bacterium]
MEIFPLDIGYYKPCANCHIPIWSSMLFRQTAKKAENIFQNKKLVLHLYGKSPCFE